MEFRAADLSEIYKIENVDQNFGKRLVKPQDEIFLVL